MMYLYCAGCFVFCVYKYLLVVVFSIINTVIISLAKMDGGGGSLVGGVRYSGTVNCQFFSVVHD